MNKIEKKQKKKKKNKSEKKSRNEFRTENPLHTLDLRRFKDIILQVFILRKLYKLKIRVKNVSL